LMNKNEMRSSRPCEQIGLLGHVVNAKFLALEFSLSGNLGAQ
jgi:hypothetical protein